MSSVRSRSFVFTKNNYSEEDVDCLKVFGEAHDNVFLIFSKEIGPNNGTPHLQGYVHFKNARFIKGLISLGIFGHLCVARGTAEENMRYIRKTRTGDVPNEWVFEHGLPPSDSKTAGTAGGAAEKQRWEDARVAAISGNLEDVPADIYIRCYGTLKKIRDDAILSNDLLTLDDLDHEWLWGESGSGKSYTARDRYPNAFLKSCNKWWDGYQAHEVVLIEDFDRKHDVLCHHLKIWADRYPFPAEVKGSSIKIRPKKIVVTSNYHPQDIWTNPSDLEPIMRRFKMTQFSGVFIPENVGVRLLEDPPSEGSSSVDD